MWKLSYGIHRGTLTSRDTGVKDGIDSLQGCKDELKEAEDWFKSIGYMIWFAYAVDPDGNKTKIHTGNSYR